MVIIVKHSATRTLRSFRCSPAENAQTNVHLTASGRIVVCPTQSVRWKVLCVMRCVPRMHDARIRSMSPSRVRCLPADFGFSALPFTLSWVNQWQIDLALTVSHPLCTSTTALSSCTLLELSKPYDALGYLPNRTPLYKPFQTHTESSGHVFGGGRGVGGRERESGSGKFRTGTQIACLPINETLN
jgi:hypothetical protein